VIHDWTTYFGDQYTLDEHAETHPNGMLERNQPAAGLSEAATATARVSGSCWIADCPRPGCGGAEFVNFADPRFFCCACRNEDWDGQPIRVIVPDEQTKTGVEEALAPRPDPDTRNWAADETVADLQAENVEQGIAVA
jgi:hypothetical protein